MYNKRKIGNDKEIIAMKYLIKNDYKILKKNYRLSKYGEIDIIASKKNIICFIEVKYRKNDDFGHPVEAVNYKKIKKIRNIAEFFIGHIDNNKYDYRFDIIEIFGESEINHIKNAF